MVEDDQSTTRPHPHLWNLATDQPINSVQEDDGAGALGDRYNASEMLGSGGMAEVWLAHDKSLQRDVAIKLMKAQFLDDPDLVERFRREGIAAASINHPNVVPIYDVGIGGGLGYLVMEHVPGGTLTQKVKNKGPLSPMAWVRLAREVLGALEAVHEKAILHRDIKPSNILFDKRGAAKLADFGIAHLDDARGLTGSMVVGTPTYLSPEVLQGELATAASDLFALGRTLIFAATGNAKNPGLSGSYAPELHYWIDQLLAFNSSARFPSATAALESLEAISRGEPTPTPSLTQPMGTVALHPPVTGNVPTLSDARPQGSSGLPWAVAGIAVGALTAVLALVLPSLHDQAPTATTALEASDAAPSLVAATPVAGANEPQGAAEASSADKEEAPASEAADSPVTTPAKETTETKQEARERKRKEREERELKAAEREERKAQALEKAQESERQSKEAEEAAAAPSTAAVSLSHNPVRQALVGTSFRLKAKTSVPASKVTVMLKIGTKSWAARAMSSKDNNTSWSFSAIADGSWVSGLQYYIIAKGESGSDSSGSKSSPHKVKVR